MINAIIKFFLYNKLVAFLLLGALVIWGISTAPFRWDLPLIPQDPVPVDAIPDIGDNQQIIFTRWDGRSPEDVDAQITYPLTTALLGVPGVRTIRSSSLFGFSSIYVIFEDGVEFYWSRSRILEKLNSLPEGTLPPGVSPALGPDATPLGQVFWYTLEGRNEKGEATGGWNLQELRSIQDFYVKYGLASAEDVAEVASIGGFVKEYQIDLDPVAMKTTGITIVDIMKAVKNSNLDVGAKTVEINQAEYFVRGLGYIESVSDIEQTVVKVIDHTPILIKDLARVSLGPAFRRGILDKAGAEVVGGVVVARFGANPLEVIENTKEKIREIAPGLPEKTLADSTKSKVTIVPFYDRSKLIYETLGTLEEALWLEILITILVIMFMVRNIRASILISGLLPVAVLMAFIMMKYVGVDANIVALSGIAIAIGTMVDVGIILTENIIRFLRNKKPGQDQTRLIYEASAEVSSAIVTAVATTIISFLPVFALQAAEGKLFTPLAFTKTFALIAAVIITLCLIPPMADLLFRIRQPKITSSAGFVPPLIATLAVITGIIFFAIGMDFGGAAFIIAGGTYLADYFLIRKKWPSFSKYIWTAAIIFLVIYLLTIEWEPLGAESSVIVNFLFVALISVGLLFLFTWFMQVYPQLLGHFLKNKRKFILVPSVVILLGIFSLTGIGWALDPFAETGELVGLDLRKNKVFSSIYHLFPGMQKEFMPPLDEGSFLLMPTTMPHASVSANKDYLQKLDMLVNSIPEVETVVGKAGRAETPLDPAPLNMFENVVIYKSEYITDEKGYRKTFQVDDEGNFARDENGELIEDEDGEYFRQWRDHIRTPDDIWNEITIASRIPGLTGASKLQPISTRLVMLQTGLRAELGIKIQGPSQEAIETFGLELERHLKEVPRVKPASVFADRLVAKPYLVIDWKRNELARYGLSIQDVQMYIESAIGGMPLTMTVEGRERYPVRVRYPRELRNSAEDLGEILIPAQNAQITISQVADIRYEKGPQIIKSENAFLIGYVTFDKEETISESEVINNIRTYLDSQMKTGRLQVPNGVSYDFAGNFENQVRAEKRLLLLVPIVLVIIFLLLFFQFRTVSLSLMVFGGIIVAWAGGFILLWLYGQPWFADFGIFGGSIRRLFHMDVVNMSVAVWVGFIALFGIATDDGVVMATYLQQMQKTHPPKTREEVRRNVLRAGRKRIRPCLMTTATTLLALLPVLTSEGRGADIMIPMAIPIFGGMLFELLTLFVVPVIYSWWNESRIKEEKSDESGTSA